MVVLIISALQDGHVGPVMRELSRRGVQAELLDHRQFPLHLALQFEYRNGCSNFSLGRPGEAGFDMRQVGAIWWRRPQPFGSVEQMTDESARRFANSEASTAFQGLYQCLEAGWVNRPDRDARASHKPWQLQVAQSVGLPVPTTLMTSDPQAAREFFHACDEKVVYKQFIALPENWRETRILSKEALSRADSISYAPVIFQEYVEAEAEVRITVIGERIFAAAVDLRKADYPVDVRFNPSLQHSPHELPSEIRVQLQQLMRRLELTYAAIDMRLTPDGRYVFLEANPAGQFLYIEQMTGQPITAALVDTLLTTHAVF